MTLSDFLEFIIFKYDDISVTLFDIIQIVLILTFARFITYFVKRIFGRAVSRKTVDHGTASSLRQLLNYFIWIITILFTLDFSGIGITVILAYSTALFVGLGLGLQDTFRDFISGIILLTERSISAGDIIEIDGMTGIVKEVGLRTTKISTRDDISVILPNSKLTNQGVINWSHQNTATRFHISVGVAYGSNTDEVKKQLIECMKKSPDVHSKPAPSVQFKNFGNSALEFNANFHSSNLFRIEFTKSDIRFSIDEAFRKNNITIAFPQMDVWMHNK